MLFLDTETTGVMPTDEILSIAIVNDAGDVLLDTYVTPTYHTRWPDAMETNHITPEFIFSGSFPTMNELHETLDRILSGEDVCAYNMAFDSAMLTNGEFPIEAYSALACCMNRMAIYNGEPSRKSYHVTGYRTLKLKDAADLTGHIWTGKQHGALADAQACRHVWQWLDANWQDPEIVVI